MVYNYTKPRGPIAAMYSSPGPCYGLPGLVGQNTHDPRSVHHKGPAYPFGIRHGKWRDDASPGPCYLPQAKCYRDGMDGAPHYSLYSRQRENLGFKTPGPGAYSPEASGPLSKYEAPKYSFGIRHRHRRTDNTPGKFHYNVFTLILKVHVCMHYLSSCSTQLLLAARHARRNHPERQATSTLLLFDRTQQDWRLPRGLAEGSIFATSHSLLLYYF